MKTLAIASFFVAIHATLLGLAPMGAAQPLQFVESFPIETALDQPDLPEAHDVWLEMIRGARTSLDFAEFYASNEAGSRLETIVQAIEAAAARGVRVRFLAENGFYRTYPETLDRLGSRQGITMRRFDVRSLTGGVLHAKYFIVDAREAYVGSQNFDWRSLTHIQELGLRIGVPEVVGAFASAFEHDWKVAAGEAPSTSPSPEVAASFPVLVVQGDDTLRVTPVFSPQDWVAGGAWDLPHLVAMIDAARRSVRVQLLTYRMVGRDSSYFADLENALRRAAARGVQVQLLLSDWSKRAGTIEGLQSLQPVPNVDIRLVTIPPWSGGFVPFARVIHAKYMVVDGERFWLGTSNWEWDYFFRSRNAGILVEGRLARRLERYFQDNWNSAYASDVDPCATYEPPRIGN